MKEIGLWYVGRCEVKWARHKFKLNIRRQKRQQKKQFVRDEYRDFVINEKQGRYSFPFFINEK